MLASPKLDQEPRARVPNHAKDGLASAGSWVQAPWQVPARAVAALPGEGIFVEVKEVAAPFIPVVLPRPRPRWSCRRSWRCAQTEGPSPSMEQLLLSQHNAHPRQGPAAFVACGGGVAGTGFFGAGHSFPGMMTTRLPRPPPRSSRRVTRLLELFVSSFWRNATRDDTPPVTVPGKVTVKTRPAHRRP